MNTKTLFSKQWFENQIALLIKIWFFIEQVLFLIESKNKNIR